MEASYVLFVIYKLVKYAVYPLTWLVLLLTLLAIVALRPNAAARLGWIRLLSASSLLLALLIGNQLIAETLVAFVEEQVPPLDRASAGPFDAIVVLGGGVNGAGSLRPSDELSGAGVQRTVCGVDLFVRGLAPRIVFSGGDGTLTATGPKEAVVMKRLAVSLGVPEEAILVEDQSRTTYENAVYTRRLLGEASVLLATSALHGPRALGLFQRQGFRARSYPCSYLAKDRPGQIRGASPFDLLPLVGPLQDTTYAVNEIVGSLVYRLSGHM